jgi:hypothetical protein
MPRKSVRHRHDVLNLKEVNSLASTNAYKQYLPLDHLIVSPPVFRAHPQCVQHLSCAGSFHCGRVSLES